MYVGTIISKEDAGGILILSCWHYRSPSRNMHALRRLNLECSLKIYVEIYEKLRIGVKLRDLRVSNCTLISFSLCISDCSG